MSRLHGRLGRLERAAQHRACPACAGREAVVDMLGPGGTPRKERELSPCPLCGERPELFNVLLAFDPRGFPDTDRGRAGGEG